MWPPAEEQSAGAFGRASELIAGAGGTVNLGTPGWDGGGDSYRSAVDAQLDLSAAPEEAQQPVTLQAPLNATKAWLKPRLHVTKRRSLHRDPDTLARD